MAKCLHCFSWTIVEFKSEEGVGPCRHSIGQHKGEPHFIGEIPLDKETVSEVVPKVDPSYVGCSACLALVLETPFGEELPLCKDHAKTPV